MTKLRNEYKVEKETIQQLLLYCVMTALKTICNFYDFLCKIKIMFLPFIKRFMQSFKFNITKSIKPNEYMQNAKKKQFVL